MKKFIKTENGMNVYEVKTGKQTGIVKEIISEKITKAQLSKIANDKRILELKELISNKKLLDMNCTTEQAELKELLGL